MRIDPAAVLHSYIASLPVMRGVMVSGTRVDRSKGQPTIVLEHAGGYRVVRDRADRAELVTHVYHQSMTLAAGMSYDLRSALLEDLPGQVVAGALVLDVAEVHAPLFLPDSMTGEYRYVHSIAAYLTDA
ncbi:hypothetical protein ACIQU6_34110 [Streptomyces sp. NPDC090442]|uniref:hypothetical protein n=1 Tax=Streptomyces sp. NPDC090442 TaxID=3365962 RepID=UPI00382D6D3C